MRRRTGAGLIALSVTGSLIVAPVALAANDSQEGKTTLEETIATKGSGFKKLKKAAGEKYKVRKDLAKSTKKRADKRKSLAFFGQLTDPQLADEMSPGRLELIDPVGGATSAAFRPQEALGPFVFDSIIRNMNANKKSRVEQGNGKKKKLQYALLTGDIADSQQYNEVGWFRGILNGENVDPFSGKPIGPDNPCKPLARTVTPAEIAALDESVAQRRYTGVQDYDDWPGQGERYNGFWDPDLGGFPNSSAIADYDAFPAYPGLMDRAQQKFKAAGLKVPWYITRGQPRHAGAGQRAGQRHRRRTCQRRGRDHRMPEAVAEQQVRPRQGRYLRLVEGVRSGRRPVRRDPRLPGQSAVGAAGPGP